MDLTIVLFALIGPFLVWPVEYFLPYPFIVEELFKAILVFLFPQKSYKPILLSGIPFAITETALYSFNIINYGSIGLFFTRLFLTSTLHSVTFLTIYLFNKKDKRLIVIGLTISILIHYLYNRYIPIY